MIKNIQNIDKYLNDQKWTEVIKLYSGLFDDEKQRTEFIIDLSASDISLAVDCKNESISNEAELKNSLADYSFQRALYFNDHFGSAKAFEALLKLNADAKVAEILASISIPTKIHKYSIQEFIVNCGVSELLVFLANVINNDNKQNKNVLDWSFQAIDGREVIEVTSEIDKYEAIIDNIKYIKNRSELIRTLYIGKFLSVFILKHLFVLVCEVTKILVDKKPIDKGQYITSGKLVECYGVNQSHLDIDIAVIEEKFELIESKRIEESDRIKRNMLNNVYRCKLKKMSKVLDGKLQYIPVAILNIPKYPRGKQIIPIDALAFLEKRETGSIILAKVVKIDLGNGDIVLMPIQSSEY